MGAEHRVNDVTLSAREGRTRVRQAPVRKTRVRKTHATKRRADRDLSKRVGWWSMPLLRRLFTLAMLTLVGSCATKPEPLPRFAPAKPVDMTGNWELDYARSDNIQAQLDIMARRWQQEAQRRARAAERGQAVVGGPQSSGRDLLALAEMAELITAPTLLEVVQSESEVRVARDNSFALVCRTDSPPPTVTVTPFGTEQCGWDGRQLFFNIDLPEGLRINHRITRAQLDDAVVIQTAVYSPTVDYPFVVRRVFNRYDPDSAGYRCTQTLSKGRVCTTEPKP